MILDDDGYRVEIETYDNSVEELLNRYEITLGLVMKLHQPWKNLYKITRKSKL